MSIRRRHTGNNNLNVSFNILFDGIDIFNYRGTSDYYDFLNAEYPTYVNLNDDQESLISHTHDNICYLYTIVNRPYMFIPKTLDSNKCLKLTWFNGNREIEINTANEYIGDYIFNEQFNCITCCINNYEEDNSNKTTIYYVKDFQLQYGDHINGYLIHINQNEVFNIYENIKNTYMLLYTFNIQPAHYPHILQCDFAMASRTTNFAVCAEQNCPEAIVPLLSQSDINLIRRRYDNDGLIYYMERNGDEVDENIIYSEEDIILHYSYTITGYMELDNIIKTSVELYIISYDFNKNALIQHIINAIIQSNTYIIDQEYCDELIRKIQDDAYLDYVLTPGFYSTFDGVDPPDTNCTRSLDFIQNYFFARGFENEAAQGSYPAHATIFSYDFHDDIEPLITPCKLFIRYSPVLANMYFGINNLEDADLQLWYGDNLNDGDCNLGIQLDIKNIVFYN